MRCMLEVAFSVYHLHFYLQPSTRLTTEYVNKRIDDFLQSFYDMHFSTEAKFCSYKGENCVISLERIQSVYNKYLLSKGECYSKLSIQVIGYTDEESEELPNGGESVAFPEDIQYIIPYIPKNRVMHKSKRSAKKEPPKIVQNVKEFKYGQKLFPNEGY